MTSSRLRAVVLAIAASLLAACATAPSDGSPCPPVVAYSREFLARASEEFDVLPPGSAIEQMLADYQVMRDQARACGRFGKLAAPAASSAESAGNTVNFADRRAAAGGDAGGGAPAAHGSCGVPV